VWIWFQKLLLYGHVGILLEFWFTGIVSLLRKHWKATGVSYIWMIWVYGMTGIAMEVMSLGIDWPFYFKAFLYMPVIYGAEALSGLAIMTITGLLQKWFGGAGGGVVPWEYEKSRWTPMGLVNFRYAILWFGVALGFDWLSAILRRVVNFIAGVS
jgi:hypothetical protein